MQAIKYIALEGCGRGYNKGKIVLTRKRGVFKEFRIIKYDWSEKRSIGT